MFNNAFDHASPNKISSTDIISHQQVSQHWFPEKEILLATSILALSLPCGIVMGYGVTTAFVRSAEDVPTMNWAWFLPAVVSMGCTLAFMRRSKPPTPPSKSAEVDQEGMPYFKR